MSTLVSTVMMATLVVGPFYLARALGLETALVGLVLSAGPLVAALTGVPAGRMVDRFGAQRMTIIGLVGIAVGAAVLSMMPARFGVAGYIAPIVVMTASYALFQAANNTVDHDRYSPGPARRHFRHAQPVAQSRADHRGIGHGRGICARIGDDRHHNGASRGRCHRHADHVRSRGDSDRRRARHCGWKPCAVVACRSVTSCAGG